MRLPQDTFIEVVRRAPLVSVDLIVRDIADRVLLGWRTNEPARGTWFVPGGVIYKGETIHEALHRVFQVELGREIDREQIRFLGVYEHFYRENFAGIPDVSTHYIVLAYEIRTADEDSLYPDGQHESLRWLDIPTLLAAEDVHENTKAYFREPKSKREEKA
ncbi:MAG: GDP-mannose mannosyl hydrolase [Anaerolineales bacterium]|nr:GDP-mannose mannosyl hydrolase [Anaerolineales bacterium]